MRNLTPLLVLALLLWPAQLLAGWIYPSWPNHALPGGGMFDRILDGPHDPSYDYTCEIWTVASPPVQIDSIPIAILDVEEAPPGGEGWKKPLALARRFGCVWADQRGLRGT